MIFNRGSEWNKWDLHVHTPDSIVHDYKKEEADDIWEKYINELEKLPEDIKVLGINDYWFLDGYKKVCEYKKQGRLSNIKLILPVVELRLRDYVGNASLNKINYHVVFSEKTRIEDIQNEFINKIEMTEFENRSLSLKNLEDFGKKIKEDTPEDKRPTDSDKQIGFNNFTILLDKVTELLSKKLFENKFLRIIGQTEWNDFRWDGSPADKKALINNVHFIFSASPTIENALKSIDSLTNQSVNNRLLHCSDAHEFYKDTYSSKVLGHCYTWIKANTTFDGLKQVIHEYDERVFIGEEPEVLKRVRENRTKYIKKLKVDKIDGYNDSKGIWFDNIDIEINSELVAIIGNKGSGKSALSDIIALLGNTYTEEHFSFLTSKKFKSKKLAENFQAILEYESTEKATQNLSSSVDKDKAERVRYLPQNYFEKLCNDLEGEGFEKALKKVVFSNLTDEQRLGANSFDELISIKTNMIDEDIKTIIPKVDQVNQEIIKLEEHRLDSFKKSQQNQYELKYSELIDHTKNKPIKIKNPTENTEKDEEQEKLIQIVNEKRSELDSKENQLKDNEQIIKTLLIEINELNTLKSDFTRLLSSINEFKQSKQEMLDKYTLEFNSLLKIEYDLSKIDDVLKAKNNQIETLRKEIFTEIEDKKTGLKVDIEVIKNFIKTTEKELSKPEQEYRKYLLEFNNWKQRVNEIIGDQHVIDTLKYYKSVLKYIDNDLNAELSQKREDRINLSLEIYDKKFEILEIFKSLKETIDATLNEYRTSLLNYNITIDATYKLENFESDFFKNIKQNKMGSFYGTDEGKIKLRELLEVKNLDSKDSFKEIFEAIIDYLEYDKREDKNHESREIFEQVHKIEDLYAYLFKLNYLMPNYELKLDNKNLSELSPGEKGALLLVFYLMLDKEEIPLLIDQPEDNLDNQSVYKIVVKFIKLAKKRRQIIMVTHNPNLAVVADAEQIIYASIDKQENNKFTVKSGAIEDIAINQCIVDILEGTRPAFDKRSYKYFS
jgi:ABC-type lipoprotein export system ATPase subunit